MYKCVAMPIDNCQYTFAELAAHVLPAYFARLEAAMRQPIAATALASMNSASKAALRVLGRDKDFPGCYVFLSEAQPVYVGISRTVVRRLVQHLNTESHYSASLVYRMAREEYPHEMKRSQAMKDEQFQSAFMHSQQRLRSMRFAFVEIGNDLELYLFEAYAAMQFDTSTWNTFRTH